MLDDESGTDEVRDGQRDTPVDALLGKLLVDHLVAGAGSRENHVIFTLESFPVKSFADARMIGTGQHDIMLTKQHLLIEAGIQMRHETDREVGCPGLEQLCGRACVFQRDNLDANTWRRSAQPAP